METLLLIIYTSCPQAGCMKLDLVPAETKTKEGASSRCRVADSLTQQALMILIMCRETLAGKIG